MDNVSEASVRDSLLEKSDLYVIMGDRGQLLGAESLQGNPDKTILVFVSWGSAESYRIDHVNEEGMNSAEVAGKYEGLAVLKDCLGFRRVRGCQFWLVDKHGKILEKRD